VSLSTASRGAFRGFINKISRLSKHLFKILRERLTKAAEIFIYNNNNNNNNNNKELQLFCSSGQFIVRCYGQLLHCIKRTLTLT